MRVRCINNNNCHYLLEMGKVYDVDQHPADPNSYLFNGHCASKSRFEVVSDNDIKTVAGDTFTNDESCRMAYLISKRFGHDVVLASLKWREMLQNNCGLVDFSRLVVRGEELEKVKV